MDEEGVLVGRGVVVTKPKTAKPTPAAAAAASTTTTTTTASTTTTKSPACNNREFQNVYTDQSGQL